MYVWLHSGTCVQPLLQRKSNECCTTSVCVFVASGIQHAMCMRHIVICGLPRYAIFFHTSQTARFQQIKKVIEHKMWFRLPLQLLSEIFLILRRNDRDKDKKNI